MIEIWRIWANFCGVSVIFCIALIVVIVAHGFLQKTIGDNGNEDFEDWERWR
jgi:hypothetical protein